MFIINISSLTSILLLTIFTGLIVYLGRETKKSIIPGGVLVVYIVLATIYSVQLILNHGVDQEITKILSNCLMVDFAYIFISFFGYLWVDDIESKDKNKKNVSNSLDWLWKKV